MFRPGTHGGSVPGRAARALRHCGRQSPSPSLALPPVTECQWHLLAGVTVTCSDSDLDSEVQAPDFEAWAQFMFRVSLRDPGSESDSEPRRPGGGRLADHSTRSQPARGPGPGLSHGARARADWESRPVSHCSTHAEVLHVTVTGPGT